MIEVTVELRDGISVQAFNKLLKIKFVTNSGTNKATLTVSQVLFYIYVNFCKKKKKSPYGIFSEARSLRPISNICGCAGLKLPVRQHPQVPNSANSNCEHIFR